MSELINGTTENKGKPTAYNHGKVGITTIKNFQIKIGKATHKK
jgi:hypothetical protein